MSLHKEQNDDSYDEEIQEEEFVCRSISDLDVMPTYKILIDLQQLFDQHGGPAAAGIV